CGTDRDGPRRMSDEAEQPKGEGEKLGTLYVVATPIGNLDDMTLRAIKVLKEVPVIAAEDTRSAQNLLRHFEIARPTMVSFFEGNEAGRTEHLMARLRGGDDVAVISEAGTPGVSDPGARLVAAAVAAGVRELTKIHEELVRGTLKDLLARFGENAPRGEVTIVVEGAPAAAAESTVDVEAEVKRRLAGGESPKEIAAALALLSGKPKRQIYQLAVALKRD